MMPKIRTSTRIHLDEKFTNIDFLVKIPITNIDFLDKIPITFQRGSLLGEDSNILLD